MIIPTLTIQGLGYVLRVEKRDEMIKFVVTNNNDVKLTEFQMEPMDTVDLAQWLQRDE